MSGFCGNGYTHFGCVDLACVREVESLTNRNKTLDIILTLQVEAAAGV